jgi:predicted dehydrogenase
MKTSRRIFLKSSAAAAVSTGVMIVPSSVLGDEKRPAPSERITLACIGVGNMGTKNLKAFLQDERVQVVAICDVDEKHRANALEVAKLKPSDGYGDFRQVLERKDIDAVMIATPDHWHSFITVAAANAGKDIYCEKPLAASIREGRIVCDTVAKNKRILQCGTWRRSGLYTRWACELVQNQYIGELREIEVGVPGEFAIRGGYTGLEAPEAVPGYFDYQMWMGPTTHAPYTAARCHFNFRWINQYAPGYITDWGAHFLDVSQWGNDSDDTTPIAVRAIDVTKRNKGIYDAAESFRIEYRYKNGVKMSMFSTTDVNKLGIKFIGEAGWVFTQDDIFITSPEKLRVTRIKNSDKRLYVSTNHHRNFIDSIKSRHPTAAPPEVAHRAATCCHLGAIAAEQVGTELSFDPVSERFTNNDLANQMLRRPMLDPWSIYHL